MERPAKRRKPDIAESSTAVQGRTPPPSSLTRSITPPTRLRKALKPESPAPRNQQQRIFKSPFQLTKIKDHSPQYNIDTVTLRDILGDPLISECWEFNYLHDIDYLMNAFDPDVRHLVKVHVVHGFWKQEDANRLALQEAASRCQNVTLHSAYMPEMFGTHHSKMMILLRHDDTAQIVIHTANLIIRDWGNMTQAVWRSPLLPLLPTTRSQQSAPEPEALKPGSGEKFKVDFLNYLASYNKRRPTCRSIAEELQKYDFSAIRGHLIASVPGRHSIHDRDSPTRWGWAAMKEALKSVPVRPGKSEIAIQISSIATLGPTDNWLRNTLFDAFSGGKPQRGGGNLKPEFKIIFPTADEIRASLDGYNSGGSIHTRISSAQQKKQLLYLKPLFYHWGDAGQNQNEKENGNGNGNGLTSPPSTQTRAAPHIKTYIRYSLSHMPHNATTTTTTNNTVNIDWALVTSANLSKQAWGEALSSSGISNGEMRIASYEIGVLVWPELFAKGAVMRGTFLSDTPEPPSDSSEQPSSVVGLRMPYSLPLRKYGRDEIPWVATASYDEPDWKGQFWRD
ncbi:putative tyrosyl-DNA phosphodiesterase [Naviculisporaceae sp. PSN 640]